MNKNEKLEEVRKVADLVFEIIPDEVQKKYDKEIYGHKFSLKDYFLVYFSNKEVRIKKIFNENDDLLKKTILLLLGSQKFQKNPNAPDITIFEHLFDEDEGLEF